MIAFSDDGTFTVDFPAGPIRVRPPTFGGMKRLRADRTRYARDAVELVEKWEAEHPEPPEAEDPENETELAAANRARTYWAQDRLEVLEEINTAAAYRWWTLALVGDGTFAGLAETAPPADVDAWPADLLYDFRPPLRTDVPIQAQLAEQARLIDQVFAHWGKGRSRSGPTGPPTP